MSILNGFLKDQDAIAFGKYVVYLVDVIGCAGTTDIVANFWIQYGGGGGIRTPERVAPLPVFKTGAFNHSATPPANLFIYVNFNIV